jgi:hypothetical protein
MLYGASMRYQFPARNRPTILPALLSLAMAGALTGCSDGGPAYPSLASRPAERITDTAPVASATSDPGASTAVPAAHSADLAARLDNLVGQARSAKRDFDDKQSAAERLIAAAGAAPVGSDDWARATQALSGVESARSLTAQPLADLDRLDVEDQLHAAQIGSAGNSAPRPDTVAIAQARDTVSALVVEEDAVLAKLDGRLAH